MCTQSLSSRSTETINIDAHTNNNHTKLMIGVGTLQVLHTYGGGHGCLSDCTGKGREKQAGEAMGQGSSGHRNREYDVRETRRHLKSEKEAILKRLNQKQQVQCTF